VVVIFLSLLEPHKGDAMAPFWNRWIERQMSSRRKNRKKRSRQRRLRLESLESRHLLAANPFHNELIPEDVNEDGLVSPGDALAIINQMNRQTASGQAQGAVGGGTDDTRGQGRMTSVNNAGHDTALDVLRVVNRLNRDRERLDRPPLTPDDGPDQPGDDPTTDLSNEVRSIDGTGNNLETPELGSVDTPLLRVAENDYADGIAEPAGEDRPSAREISNTVSAADPEGTSSERDLSSFVFIWGQFLDHDIDVSLEPEDEADAVAFDIEVPEGDPLFDPFGTGEETIHLTRSEIAEGTGTSVDNPAEQVNAITAWIDGSQVYGSTQEVADSLREFEGGRLLISDDGLLPTDDEGNLLAGDFRAAENIGLTSMHTLFVREHNRLADEISAANPDLSDEEIYQQARATVIAELQSITYNEFLPALLGQNALTDYEGYDSSVNPSIANEFSTAAFRFGHTTLNDTIGFYGNDGLDVDEAISLADAFFNASLLEETGIDSILKAGASTLSQETDLEVVDSLRNFLFGAPGSGGLDLVSLNIQRGRDHGLADFNSVREAYGLETYGSFADITSDVELQGKLEALYGDVNNIDLWVGLLAEDHAEGSSLGETATTIIADQFERLRDGDRFYYENTLSGSELRNVENTTLADIIERNTNADSLQANVFVFTPTVAGTVTEAAATSGQFTAQQETGPNRDNTRRGDRSVDGRRGSTNPDNASDAPVAGIAVELLDSEGNLVDTALTDSDGNYKFASFDRTGLYHIQIASSNLVGVVGSDLFEVLVSSGDVHLNDLNFEVTI